MPAGIEFAGWPEKLTVKVRHQPIRGSIGSPWTWLGPHRVAVGGVVDRQAG
jgi:hypothetical protein